MSMAQIATQILERRPEKSGHQLPPRLVSEPGFFGFDGGVDGAEAFDVGFSFPDLLPEVMWRVSNCGPPKVRFET